MEELLKNHSKIKKFKKAEVIFQERSRPQGLYFLRRGMIKVFRTDESGKEMILRLAKEGDVLAPYFITSKAEHLYSAEALEDAEVYLVGQFEFLTLEANRLYPYLLEKITLELSHTQKRCLDLMSKSVRERLANHFYEMATHFSEESTQGLKVKVKLSREEIASMVGTAHETAIRFIGEFKLQGLIKEEDKRFYILNPQRLAEISLQKQGQAHECCITNS